MPPTPQGFPPEPPRKTAGCGWSWSIPQAVTGTLKGGIAFGSQYREVLPPLASRLPSQPGRDTEEERELLEDLAQFLGDRSQVVATSTVLNSQQKQALASVLQRTEEMFSEIRALYEKWNQYPCFPGLGAQATTRCPWPLSWGDSTSAWRQQCGEPGAAGATFEGYDPVTRSTKTFSCPAPAGSASDPLAPQKRSQDRARIENLILGILHHLRCAQYAYTRIVLHARALEAYREEHMFAEGFGAEEPTEPSPTPGVGGFAGFDPDPFDPNEFPGNEPQEFDPADVQGVPLAPGVEDPFDEPLPTDQPPVPGPDAEPGPDSAAPSDEQSTANKWAIGIGAVTAAIVLWKSLR